MRLKIEILADENLSDQLRSIIGKWSAEMFGKQEFIKNFIWAKPHWRVLLFDDDKLVSHVKVTEQTGVVNNVKIKFAGIGGVMTPGKLRKKGYASSALEAARQFIFSELHADSGLLFCLEKMIPFYENKGWKLVSFPVYVEQPGRKVKWSEKAMILPGKKVVLNGEINLCGYPF